eukprot:TRINITY_DN7709_c0_g3_i1.p1 TRINITY_DN7709_c0_g3~~TRINITY_DN7709_c0_g3_i1.p1  ORF type:complete len:191 (+),score=41.20 TRINITY_DN7709_c0_g3_i1:55-573(+)
MGLSGSHLQVHRFRDASPWSTEIFVKNNMQTPVLILEARSHTHPTHENAVEHVVPPGEHAIVSGWLREPRATLYLRTGLYGAKVIRVPNGGSIMISVAPHGLKVESQDANVEIEGVDSIGVDPACIRGCDTVPMLLRHESFEKENSTASKPKQPPVVSASAGSSSRPPLLSL